MDTKILHGELTPDDIARALGAAFNRGNYQVQRFGSGDNLTVQIATRQARESGGATALTIQLSRVTDGVSVSMGSQSWFGLAASLGMTALSALRDPRLLLGRIDDLAQDVESAQLIESVWQVIDQTARSRGAGTALSDRLSRTVCPYCQTANPVASGRCLACGAPLGGVQPHTCPQCGFALLSEEKTCPNCGAVLQN